MVARRSRRRRRRRERPRSTPPRTNPSQISRRLWMPRMTISRSSGSRAHTVKKGDTLWDIARTYLGDPFLWPQIYKLNTDLAKDPHWIYPDQVLRLTGAPGEKAVPDKDTPPPPAAPAPAAAPA